MYMVIRMLPREGQFCNTWRMLSWKEQKRFPERDSFVIVEECGPEKDSFRIVEECCAVMNSFVIVEERCPEKDRLVIFEKCCAVKKIAFMKRIVL